MGWAQGISLLLVCLVVIWQFLSLTIASRFSETLPPIPGSTIETTIRVAVGERGSSSLWIVCSREKQLLLALHARFLPDEAFIRDGIYTKQYIEISFRPDSRRTSSNIPGRPVLSFREATMRRHRGSDVLYTPPLSQADTEILLLSYHVPPGVINVSAMESGRVMSSVAKDGDISAFAASCVE